MGWDYALVHVKYTIPPAVLLTLLYRPFFTRFDIYKVALLVFIAVVSTIPWDSYLIRANVWSYPPDAVVGFTFWSIPAEELFFFVIQTYDVALLHLCLTKPILLPAYLHHDQLDKQSSRFAVRHSRAIVLFVQAFLAIGIYRAWLAWMEGGRGMYMGLIVMWAFPFVLLLWSLGGQFMLHLPRAATFYAVMIPTVYLWFVDTLALRRGTWVIESGTKLGIDFGIGLDIEEAVFFFLTNAMVVSGLCVFDMAMALIHIYPELAPATSIPSPWLAVQTLLLPSSCYDCRRIQGLREANARLQKKSRSFYLASATFSGPLRYDLVLTYSFCRAADDLVDAAPKQADAASWVDALDIFLRKSYDANIMHTDNYIRDKFPTDTRLAFLNLPVDRLSQRPLLDLLRGFRTDLQFWPEGKDWPIRTEKDLLDYGYCVAGTVAVSVIELVFSHYSKDIAPALQAELKQAGIDMGKALQTVNIARDIAVDAKLGRVYIPSDWLKEKGLRHEDVLKDPSAPAMAELRTRLLDVAFAHYARAKNAIDRLPRAARGPMRVATESYMEIGRVLRDESYQVQAGRATVPALRRARVAWAALY